MLTEEAHLLLRRGMHSRLLKTGARGLDLGGFKIQQAAFLQRAQRREGALTPGAGEDQGERVCDALDRAECVAPGRRCCCV